MTDSSDDENSDNEVSEPSPKKVRRYKGEIIPNEKGYILLDQKVWQSLEKDQKGFIQRYNVKVKHKENLSELNVPDGITVCNRIR